MTVDRWMAWISGWVLRFLRVGSWKKEKECVDWGRKSTEMLSWAFDSKSWWIFLIFAMKAIHAVPSGSPAADNFYKDFYISISQIFHVIFSVKHQISHQQSSFWSFLQHVCSGDSHKLKRSDRKQPNILVEITTQWFCHRGSLFSGNKTDAKKSDPVLLKALGWTGITWLMSLLSVNCCLQHNLWVTLKISFWNIIVDGRLTNLASVSEFLLYMYTSVKSGLNN